MVLLLCVVVGVVVGVVVAAAGACVQSFLPTLAYPRRCLCIRRPKPAVQWRRLRRVEW